MRATSTWQEEQRFETVSESGHRVAMDAGPEHAGGPSPMETVLMALCACTSVDVASILRKKREPLTGLTVTAEAEQAETPPRVFTRIRLTYRVAGEVSPKAVADAVALSEKKYCSVSRMLEKTAAIEISIELAGAAPEERP
jgi:putative redox protein